MDAPGMDATVVDVESHTRVRSRSGQSLCAVVPGPVVQAGGDPGAVSVWGSWVASSWPLSGCVASGSRFLLLNLILSSVNGGADYRCGS